MPHEMVELAKQLDDQATRLNNQSNRLMYLTGLLERSLDAAGQDRSIAQIIEECGKEHGNDNTPFFNITEVERLVNNLMDGHKELEQYKTANKELAAERSELSPEAVLACIETNNVVRFTFREVRQLVEHFRKKYPWKARPERKNIKELMDLVRQDDPRMFTSNEMNMMHRWGREQQTAFRELKVRLGRAFADPKAWVDQATGFFLSDSAKRAMLNAGSINAASFQEGLYSRPTYLNLPDAGLNDPNRQFHAGEHFHTDMTTGLWWSGRQFSGMTSAELQKMLEETLGDLRAIYIEHPQGAKK
jgi:hypothetical protein